VEAICGLRAALVAGENRLTWHYGAAVEAPRLVPPNLIGPPRAEAAHSHWQFAPSINATAVAAALCGGVFPTYLWRAVLTAEPRIDVVARGEGEDTVLRLMSALAHGDPLGRSDGIAFRQNGRLLATAPAPMKRDLDHVRIAMADQHGIARMPWRRDVTLQPCWQRRRMVAPSLCRAHWAWHRPQRCG
jgi:hypothetical protein